MGLIIIGLVVYFIIAWLIAQEFQEIAYKKGYSEKKYFWFSFLFGIVGYLMVIALPINKVNDEDIITNNTISSETKKEKVFFGDFSAHQFSKDDGIKQCPNCGVCHDSESNVCPSCKYQYNS